ncbi:MAG: carbohydrate porin [Bacteroidales bacterium]|nr:carbohydrate porin [Bacteroidales bacterium]
MMRYLIVIAIAFMSLYEGYSQINADERMVKWNFSYTSDVGRNILGGVRKGNVFMGLIDVGVEINSSKYWVGSSLIINGMNTHGSLLSENYIGDKQVVSNIENGNYTFIELLYLKHHFRSVALMVGLQDFNAEFCTSEYGSIFTNSSFGIHSTFPLNIGVPIFPKTALAFTGIVPLFEKIKLKAGVWDGDPGVLKNDIHNFDWSFSNNEGFLYVGQIDFNTSDKLITDINLGVIYHSSEFFNLVDSSRVKGNYGFYTNIDKELLIRGFRSFGAFGQMAWFPSKGNVNEKYFGVGVVYKGIFEKQKDDCMALGCAFVNFYNNEYETDIEFNYTYNLNKYLNIQPVLHYIINPGANDMYKNSLAAFLRISVMFN